MVVIPGVIYPIRGKHGWCMHLYLFICYVACVCGLPHWLSGKESASNVGDAGDTGKIPGSGRSPGGGCGNHASIIAWRIPWTEEPGGRWSIGLQKV